MSKPSVLRLMGQANFLAPTRTGAARRPRDHDGKIITEEPNQMWGTEGPTTEFRIHHNQRWRLECHGYRSPAAVRAAFVALSVAG